GRAGGAERGGVEAAREMAAVGGCGERAERGQRGGLAGAGRPGPRDIVARLYHQVCRTQRGHRRRSRVGAGQPAQLDHRPGDPCCHQPLTTTRSPAASAPEVTGPEGVTWTYPFSEMPGVTGTRFCWPCAPTTVTELVPAAVVTMAATGTVSTGPSVCPVSTVTRTFSPFSAEASGLDGRTVSGMNAVELQPAEPDDPHDPEDPEDPVDPEPADPEEPAGPEPPPTLTVTPAGTVVVGVPRSATVPVAWMPVTSS